MSDLISRSELLKEIEKYKFGAISNDAEREYIKKTILDFIICQPTAYSVDRVVEELREIVNPKEMYFCRVSKGRCIHDEDDIGCIDCLAQKAIEIVKAGQCV